MMTTDRIRRATLLITAASCIATLAGCGGSKEKNVQSSVPARSTVDPALAKRGQDIFRNRDFGSAGIACADCHSDADESVPSETRIFPGHSVVGAAGRISAWNGEFSGAALRRTAAGAAKCARIYQERESSNTWAITQDEAAALTAFYQAISTGNEAKRIAWDALTWPGDSTASKETLAKSSERILAMRGDAARGAALFQKACAICHGKDGLGIGPSTRVLAKRREDLPTAVRAGVKNMPFFSRDRLTDQNIADILAWVDAEGR